MAPFIGLHYPQVYLLVISVLIGYYTITVTLSGVFVLESSSGPFDPERTSSHQLSPLHRSGGVTVQKEEHRWFALLSFSMDGFFPYGTDVGVLGDSSGLG